MIKWYYIFILSLVFISCEEDKPPKDPSIYFGNFSSDFNGERWEANVRAKHSISRSDYFLLSFDTFEGLYLRTELHIKFVEFSVGKIQILNPDYDGKCDVLCATFGTGYDDQSGDFYTILDSDKFQDWVIIDSLNNQTLEFWGRFQASFVRDFEIPKMDTYPDTLYFENGVFNGKIIE